MNKTTTAHLFGIFSAVAFIHAAAGADPDDGPASSPATATNSWSGSDPRYGPFNWLDHRSMYTQEVFPEPFLLDDMAYEDNELELTWLHTKGNGQQTDIGAVEFQKGIGLLTLLVEVPYERNVDPDDTTRGFGSVQIGARYPLYQTVSADRFVDATFGVAMEGGLPVHHAVSRNAELDPQIFNDLKLGDSFTVQTILGYSTLLGNGDDGGLRSFEYGVSLACAMPHRDFRLPGVDQFIPMLELTGETGLNKAESGENSLEGDAGFRVLFKPMGEFRPGLGIAYVFPIDGGARQELRWGFVISTTFEF
jgi:hypothetical protein